MKIILHEGYRGTKWGGVYYPRGEYTDMVMPADLMVYLVEEQKKATWVEEPTIPDETIAPQEEKPTPKRRNARS